jgi:hypothetical protein
VGEKLLPFLRSALQTLAGHLGLVVGGVVSLVSFSEWLTNWVSSRIVVALSAVRTSAAYDATSASAPWQADLLTYVSVANWFLPIPETIALLTGLAVLWVSATGYRFVKSWIPTVS